MSRTIVVCALALFVPVTVLAQEAERPPCPPVVDLPTEATVAGLRACGEEALADASERRIRILRGLAEETVAAAPVVAPVSPPAAVTLDDAAERAEAVVADAERAALLERLRLLEEDLRALREERVAEPPTVVPVEPTTPRLPYIGEAAASMSGGMPLVTSLPGFLHRRPVPWSSRRGLRLWNGLFCLGSGGVAHFTIAAEVRVDGRVVIPVEMGSAWPAIPVIDSHGVRSTAYLLPPGRDRLSGSYTYIPVGPGHHNVVVTIYDAPLGMTPMRLAGGSFDFDPSGPGGDLLSLRWDELGGRRCGAP
ncbi:hypothetical protein EPO33_04085 [Patescibacteria group bacterium]|nr:MAG: hypothetical protein EPO33_04085 [Patescibacteria group bacterium]